MKRLASILALLPAVVLASGIQMNGQANMGAATGILTVPNGGTGVATFTTNGIHYGNGTSPILVTAAGTAGQAFLAGASGVPAFFSLTGDVSGVGATGIVTLASGQANIRSFTNSVTLSSTTQFTGVGTFAAGWLAQASSSITAGTLTTQDISMASGFFHVATSGIVFDSTGFTIQSGGAVISITSGNGGNTTFLFSAGGNAAVKAGSFNATNSGTVFARNGANIITSSGTSTTWIGLGADGATATPNIIDTQAAMITSGALLVSFRNFGTEKAKIDLNGLGTFNGGVTSTGTLTANGAFTIASGQTAYSASVFTMNSGATANAAISISAGGLQVVGGITVASASTSNVLNQDLLWPIFDPAGVTGATIIAKFGPTKGAMTVADVTHVVPTLGTGTGSITLKMCSTGDCTGGTIFATCSAIACNGAAGLVTACTVNTAAVPAATTLFWMITTPCTTSDVPSNISTHFTQ